MVQRQPPICRLSRAHLAKRETGAVQKVVLAPFCIAATLSRQCHVNFETDNQVSHFLIGALIASIGFLFRLGFEIMEGMVGILSLA